MASMLELPGAQVCKGKDKYGTFVRVEYPYDGSDFLEHVVNTQNGKVPSIALSGQSEMVLHIFRDWAHNVPLQQVRFTELDASGQYDQTKPTNVGDPFTIDPSTINTRCK